MHKLIGIAAVAVACSAALPAAAGAQAPLPPLPLPLPLPADPGLPALPALPALPVPVPVPPDSTVDPLGQVFDAAGQLLGVIDTATGLLIPAAATPTPTTPAGTTGTATTGTARPTTTTTTTTAKPTTTSTATNGAASRADTVAPGLSLRVSYSTSSVNARKKGLRVVARCTEACRLTLRLTKGAQYASVTKTLRANKTTALNLKLNSGAKKVLARAQRGTKLTLRGQATDTAGNRSKILSRTAIVRGVGQR